MSYDILLYPREPGQDWATVLEADEAETDEAVLEDPAALEGGVATFRRIEARLREVLGDDVESWVAEETGGDVFGELSDATTGLQVELYHGSASVAFPYREREDAAGFHDQVRRAVQVVAEETGFEAYDRQRDDTFDGTIDDGPGLAAARGSAQQEGAPLEGTVVAGSGGPIAPGEAPEGVPTTTSPADIRQDPAFMRRRGWLYLVLGALLTAYGLWRLTTPATGWLTGLVLAIGVFDLLGGLFMLSIARRIEGEAKPQP